MDAKVHSMEKELRRQAGEMMELEGKVKHLVFEVIELKNLFEELRMDIFEKKSRLDHLQKKNEEFSSSMDKAKDEAIKEFQAFGAYTEPLNETYVVGFEDFCLDAREAFLGVHFDSIKLPMAGESSSLPSTFEDIDIGDDATTKDDAQPLDAVQLEDDTSASSSK